MPHFAKRLLVATLTPLALVTDRLEALRRVWAHTRLRAALGGRLDASVVVSGTPELHGTRRIVLGRNLYLYRDIYLETQGQGLIRIGDDVVISRGVHVVAFEEVVIEDGVMIGEYTSVRDANHRVVAGRSVRNTGHQSAPIRICRNAWIGRGVTVLPGVTIGVSAVVGANAVVTRDVQPDTLVVGVPARTPAPTTVG